MSLGNKREKGKQGGKPGHQEHVVLNAHKQAYALEAPALTLHCLFPVKIPCAWESEKTNVTMAAENHKQTLLGQ